MRTEQQNETMRREKNDDRYAVNKLSDEDIVQAVKIEEYKKNMGSQSEKEESVIGSIAKNFSIDAYQKYRLWLSAGKPLPSDKSIAGSVLAAIDQSQPEQTQTEQAKPEQQKSTEQEVAEQEGKEEAEQEAQEEESQEQAQPEQTQPNTEEQKPEKDLKNMGKGQGDLAHHEYTGRGPEAKHKSRVHEKLDFAANNDEKALQENVIARISEEYDKEIESREEKRAASKQQKQALKDAHKEEYERLDAIYKTMNHMAEMAEQNESASKEQKGQIIYLRGEYRAVQKQKERSIKKLTKVIPKEEELQDSIVSLAGDISEATRIVAELETGSPGFLAKRKIEYYKWRIKGWKEKAQKKEEKLKEVQAEREGLAEEIREFEIRLKEMSQSIEEISQSLADSQDIAALYKEQHELLMKEHGAELDNTEWFQQIKAIQKERKQGSEEIEKLKAKKASVKDEVLASDVIHVATEKYGDTVNGIYIDGKLYMENGDIYKENEKNNLNGTYEQKDMEIQIEEQKIVRALRQREIFKYINSDNLMEYMTYDEKAGDFELPEEVEPDMQKEQIIAKFKEIEASMKKLGLEAKLADVFAAATSGGEFDPEKVSASLLQEAMRIEATAGARFEDDAENYDGYEGFKKRTALAAKGVASGVGNVTKTLYGMVKGGVLDYLGVSSFLAGRDAKRTGDGGISTNAPMRYYNGVLTMMGPLTTGIDKVAEGALKGAGLVYEHSALLGTLKLGDIPGIKNIGMLKSMELFGSTQMSVVGAVGSGISMGLDIVNSETARREKNRMRNAATAKINKGQNRYGRIINDAATEKAIEQFNAYVNLAKDGIGLGFALAGIGGLGVTAIMMVAGIAAKKIGGAIKRSSYKKEVLNSPEILGGINYSDKLIDTKHFNALLADVTGLNDKDSLYDVIKITDGIDLHRAMRASMMNPNPDVDEAMAGLGFRDKTKYGNIKLSDIYKKIGYDGEWKTGIRNAIEIKGVDYNTSWSKFVRGVLGQDHYRNKESLKRVSREDMAKKRREDAKAALKK
ncbi:MAG: hypothetical protein J6B06_06230 [Lachnospiraceae bacterium]|nr:hypothetical protein [Lachnospiraceae bacterium]